MGRKLDVDLLVTTAEIVQRLGLTESRTVNGWMRRYDDFPKPAIARGERVLLWYWPEVDAWARKTNRTKP